jgi:rare lipoprotein A
MRKFLLMLPLLMLPHKAVAHHALHWRHSHGHRRDQEVGLVSFYGPHWNGRKTASGQRFHSWMLTCASRTLPLGTLVRVTNETNGSSVVLQVNDRGPYVRPRILDLSEGAAGHLHMIHAGLARVRVAVLGFRKIHH